MKKRLLLRDLGFFTIMAILVIALWKNNTVLGLILTIEFLVAAKFYNVRERIFFIFIGISGMLIEICGGLLGIWAYQYPNLLTIPHWIFFSWGFTFMAFHSIYLNLRRS